MTDVLEWVVAGAAGVSLVLAGRTAPVRWPAMLWMSGLWIATIVVFVVLLVTEGLSAGPLNCLCVGSAVGAGWYAVRQRAERRRVGREIAEKWARDRAAIEKRHRQPVRAWDEPPPADGRSAGGSINFGVARATSIYEPPLADSRWAEGGS